MTSFPNRHKYLGASEIGQALSMNRYGSARELWEQKTLRAGPTPHLDIFDRGHFMEDAMVDILKKKYSIEVYDRQLECMSPDRDYIISHIDGLIGQDSPHISTAMSIDQVGPGIVEFKAPGSRAQIAYEADGIPAYTLLQMHFNMRNADVKWGVFIYLDYDNWDIVPVYLERDDMLVDGCLPYLDVFWDCVKNDVEPVDKPQSPASLQTPQMEPGQTFRKDDPVVVQRMKNADIAFKNAKDAFEREKAAIMDHMTQVNADHVVYAGNGSTLDVKWRHTAPRVSIDGKKLKSWTEMLVKSIISGNNSLTDDLVKKYDGDLFNKVGAASRRFTYTIRED